MKLRHVVVLWDPGSQDFWMRPRGFNVFQVQLMVGRLKVDPARRCVTGYEIRFSSGFPVVMVLLLFTAYAMFSQTVPVVDKGPSAAQYVAFAAVFFLFAGYINLKIIRGRMEKLVIDAITEIRDAPRTSL